MTHDVPPSLSYVFTIVAEVPDEKDFILIEERAGDQLFFIPITGGPVTGQVSGSIIPGGGDWCTFRADGSFDVEARYQFATNEGEVVDVFNVGILRGLESEASDSSELGYFLTSPRFRTSSPRLAWLTRSVFVGRAVSQPGCTTIHVFEVLE
jgi:hypothetical protein